MLDGRGRTTVLLWRRPLSVLLPFAREALDRGALEAEALRRLGDLPAEADGLGTAWKHKRRDGGAPDPIARAVGAVSPEAFPCIYTARTELLSGDGGCASPGRSTRSSLACCRTQSRPRRRIRERRAKTGEKYSTAKRQLDAAVRFLQLGRFGWMSWGGRSRMSAAPSHKSRW
jgi:hypothetical protein